MPRHLFLILLRDSVVPPPSSWSLPKTHCRSCLPESIHSAFSWRLLELSKLRVALPLRFLLPSFLWLKPYLLQKTLPSQPSYLWLFLSFVSSQFLVMKTLLSRILEGRICSRQGKTFENICYLAANGESPEWFLKLSFLQGPITYLFCLLQPSLLI